MEGQFARPSSCILCPWSEAKDAASRLKALPESYDYSGVVDRWVCTRCKLAVGKHYRYYHQINWSRITWNYLITVLRMKLGPEGGADLKFIGPSDSCGPVRLSVALPIILDGLFVVAKPDTGADANANAATMAQHLGLEPTRPSDAEFQLANGRSVPSRGIISASFRFAKAICGNNGTNSSDQQLLHIEFELFDNLITDLIIGRAVLDATETLTRFSHRLYITRDTTSTIPYISTLS